MNQFYGMNTPSLLQRLLRLNAIADIGLLYSSNEYDCERYKEIKESCREMLQEATGMDHESAAAVFPPVADYPTVKVDLRALVLSADKKILMVQEKADGRWSLPGGWAEIGGSPAENIIREVKEETGLDVEVIRLTAVFDKSKHPHPPKAFYIYKMIFFCEIVSGTLEKGHDLLDVNFFSVSKLPPLSEDRILRSQIEMTYRKILENDLSVYVD
jgi:ADP-ribose pyrophosphatase YjhB (NUDIX family)